MHVERPPVVTDARLVTVDLDNCAALLTVRVVVSVHAGAALGDEMGASATVRRTAIAGTSDERRAIPWSSAISGDVDGTPSEPSERSRARASPRDAGSRGAPPARRSR